MSSRATKSRRRQLIMRTLAILAVALVILGALGAVGYQFFTGWRARDLAAKAKDNFEKANYRIAWLQINSAKDLRPDEPEVLRVLGKIEGAMGQAKALDHYAKLSQKTDLTPEDLQARAEIATRFGDDEQFSEAVGDLEKAGLALEAGKLRTARKLRKGDVDRAISEARAAAGASEDPALKLALARLLVQRYRPEFGPGKSPSAEALAGSAETNDIIDSLLDTTERNAALAFALNEINTSPENRIRWANAAMEKVETDNPALLPAAAVLVRAGQKTPQEIHGQLRPIFDAAPLERRSAYALWLSGAGLPKEALTLITAQEAADNQAAFLVRADALGSDGNWAAVITATDNAPSLPESVRLMTRARAELATGENDAGLRSVKASILAAAQEGRLANMVESADAIGPVTSTAVNEGLFMLCGQTAPADTAFRLLRRRLGRTEGTAAVVPAWQRAKEVAPDAASVRDFSRYQDLFQGSMLTPEEAAAAVAENPAEIDPRVNQALLLIRRNRQAEAAAVFDRFGITFRDLPPGQQAVLAAAASCAGDKNLARSLVNNVRLDVLTPGEKALLDQFAPKP